MNPRNASVRIILALTFGSAVWMPSASAQCSDWRTGPLIDVEADWFSDSIHAFTLWDPDGAGPEGTWLIAGGPFKRIGGIEARQVAGWDGSRWHTIGAGLEPNGNGETVADVHALCVYNGELIAAGTFPVIGGGTQGNVARYRAGVWQPMGNGLGFHSGNTVSDLKVFNGELYAGGYYYANNGAQFESLARFNGSSWQVVGGGIENASGDPPSVSEMAIYNNQLVVAGSFDIAGGWAHSNIAAWTGSAWVPVGSGVVNSVSTLLVHNGELIVGGDLISAGSVGLQNAGAWNGSTWRALGALDGYAPYGMAVFNGSAVAGGFISTVGPNPSYGLARWDGSQWVPFAGGLGGLAVPWAVATYGNKLFVGGYFDGAGSPLAPVWNYASYDGANWSMPRGGAVVNAMTTFMGQMVSGGSFSVGTGVSTVATNLSTWNGAELTPVGQASPNATVRALKAYTGTATNSYLVAGGDFTTVGAVAANRIAQRHDNGIIQGSWSPLGPGVNGAVCALERFNGATYAGGYFTATGDGLTSLNRIARWNGSTWQQIGPDAAKGVNGTVFAMKGYTFPGGATVGLIVAGVFTSAGGKPCSNVALYSESTVMSSTAWSGYGTAAFNGIVYAAERYLGSTYVAGAFSNVGGTPIGFVARWNGSAWVPVGTGTNGTVYSLKVENGLLYAGGDFSVAGGVAASRLASWDGTNWSAVQGGADSTVLALAGNFHGELHAGGSFTSVKNSTVKSGGWARYLQTGAPWIARQSLGSPQTCAGGTAAFSVTPAAGYDNLTYTWRRDGVALTMGTTPWGSVLSGGATTLDITNAFMADSGVYDCVVSNGCGSSTSSGVTLTVCGADFNCDGFVDGIDYDQFNNNFEAGSNGADYNRDGFVDGIDYDQFNNSFEAGC